MIKCEFGEFKLAYKKDYGEGFEMKFAGCEAKSEQG